MIRADLQFERGNFSLEVRFESAGRVIGVFGPSGAGKSTLISLLAGLEQPRRGSIAVEGRTLFDRPASINVPAHQRRLGVAFQEHRLFPHLSVRGNLLYGAQPGGGGPAAAPIIDLLGLTPLLSRRVHELSGGERQRVALGRALICRPRALLLDEPLASLDRALKRQIMPYLCRVRDSAAVPMLYVSHDLSEILQLTDELLLLDRGSVVGHGRYLDLVHDRAAQALLHDRGMCNLVAGRVIRDSPEDGQSTLQLGDIGDRSQQLVIPHCGSPVGTIVTALVHPWDIALATDPIHAISIQNQLRGTVTRSSLHAHGMIVEVDAGATLIAEISPRSAAALGIEPGRQLYCLIKSRAVRCASNAPPRSALLESSPRAGSVDQP